GLLAPPCYAGAVCKSDQSRRRDPPTSNPRSKDEKTERHGDLHRARNVSVYSGPYESNRRVVWKRRPMSSHGEFLDGAQPYHGGQSQFHLLASPFNHHGAARRGCQVPPVRPRIAPGQTPTT